jgi:hypothetical protein
MIPGAMTALGQNRAITDLTVMHKVFLRTDQTVVVERHNKRRATPRFERQKRVHQPIVRVHHVGFELRNNATQGGDQFGVWKGRRMSAFIFQKQSRQSLKRALDPVDGDIVCGFRVTGAREPECYNADRMTAPTQSRRQIANVTLFTSSNRRIKL